MNFKKTIGIALIKRPLERNSARRTAIDLSAARKLKQDFFFVVVFIIRNIWDSLVIDPLQRMYGHLFAINLRMGPH